MIIAAGEGRLEAVRLLAWSGFNVNVIRRAGPRNSALHEVAAYLAGLEAAR